MIIQRKLGPASPGSKKYREKYGDQFVCIRYKYDSIKGIKIKTVELQITDFRRTLAKTETAGSTQQNRYHSNQL